MFNVTGTGGPAESGGDHRLHDQEQDSLMEKEQYFDHDHLGDDQLHTPGAQAQTPGSPDIEIVHEDLEFDPSPTLTAIVQLPLTHTQESPTILPQTLDLYPEVPAPGIENLTNILLALTGGSAPTTNQIVKHSFISCSSKPAPGLVARTPSQSKLTLTTVQGTTFQIPRFIFLQPTCRICLLEKSDMVYLFEDCKTNTKGPSCSKFNLLQAIKTLVDVDPQAGDGLPEHICLECYNQIIDFSLFRKKINLSQCKLESILKQVANSPTPTVIPVLGETDFSNTQIFKFTDKILKGKSLLENSEFSYLTIRILSHSVFEKIFMTLGGMLGVKSNKLVGLKKYVIEEPFVKGWFCDPCRKIIWGGKAGYLEHFATLHEMNAEDVPFPCDICGSVFLEMDSSGIAESYAEHWLRHFFFHSCSVCGKNLPGPQALTLHKEVNHPENGAVLKCQVCFKVFKKRDYLRAHMRTHGTEEERKSSSSKTCHICGKELKSNLADHIASVHTQTRKWKCEICSSTYKTRESLSVHRSAVHAGDSTLSSGDREFKCNRCYAKCKSHAELSLHMLRHTGTTKACNLCSKKFSTPEALTLHKEKSHKKNLRYSCPTCGKFFRRKEYLSVHSKVHKAELEHQCEICGKKIRMKSNFLKHMRIHEKKKDAESQLQNDLAFTVEDK